MPELSRFYGIVVRMFFNDHNPPYFHSYYGSDEALFANVSETSGPYAEFCLIFCT
jgi:hypothetical protein